MLNKKKIIDCNRRLFKLRMMYGVMSLLIICLVNTQVFADFDIIDEADETAEVTAPDATTSEATSKTTGSVVEKIPMAVAEKQEKKEKKANKAEKKGANAIVKKTNGIVNPEKKSAAKEEVIPEECEVGVLCYLPINLDKPEKNALNRPNAPPSMLLEIMPKLAINPKCQGYYVKLKWDSNNEPVCNVPKCELKKHEIKADIDNCCFNAYKSDKPEIKEPLPVSLSKAEWKKHLLDVKDMCAYYGSHTQGQPVAPVSMAK